MTGYVVVIEGDEQVGFSSYSPDVPGVVAAGSTREETETLMREAMTEHIAILRETGQGVPEPTADVQATVMTLPGPDVRV